MGADGSVAGEHKLVYTTHHQAYTKLIEEKLGVAQFCSENSCDEKALWESMKLLVAENPDVLAFVNVITSMTDYGAPSVASSIAVVVPCNIGDA